MGTASTFNLTGAVSPSAEQGILASSLSCLDLRTSGFGCI